MNNEIYDIKGNILKVGDYIIPLSSAHYIFRNKEYYKIEKILNKQIVLIKNDFNRLDWMSSDYLSSNFIKKVNCLKIKIRKLKRLINK